MSTAAVAPVFSCSLATVERLAASRKMTIGDVLEPGEVQDQEVAFDSVDRLRSVAARLAVPVSLLLDETELGDLDAGVKVCHRDEGFSRVSERDGRSYYTYHHLVTTSAAPTMMALRVELHCRDEDHVVLNGGHDSQEVVYVTRGIVAMEWLGPDGASRKSVLSPGDSAYIHPGVPHSFRAVDSGAELLAFNY